MLVYQRVYIYILWKGHLRLPNLTKTKAGLGAPRAAAVRTDPGCQRRADSATMAEDFNHGVTVKVLDIESLESLQGGAPVR